MISYRERLLASTVTTIVGAGALVAPQAASAACTVTATTVICATTTTTDTTNAGATPANDRNYLVDTSAAAFRSTVFNGNIVDGFGLAFTNTVGGTNALNVTIDGALQVNSGNVPTAGGSAAALVINAISATPVNYFGTGTITNLGGTASNDGLHVNAAGTGAINVVVAGNVSVVAPGTSGIRISSTGTAGNISVAVPPLQTSPSADGGLISLRVGEIGIISNVSNPASTATTFINNTGRIGSQIAALNTFGTGIVATSAGLGSVSVINNGSIGATTDRARVSGIEALISNTGSSAALSVEGVSRIFRVPASSPPTPAPARPRSITPARSIRPARAESLPRQRPARPPLPPAR